MPMDLLTPLGAAELLRANYTHQLKQTINAYLPSHIFVGEALQNALDAVRESPYLKNEISVFMDFDERKVTVADTGRGFPNNPALLFLGGGTKANLKLAGMVGVGLKVVLFSSRDFRIRATNPTESIMVRIQDAHRYSDPSPPDLTLPIQEGFEEDPAPVRDGKQGTEITYEFPSGAHSVPERFLRDVYEDCIEGRANRQFRESLDNALRNGFYESRLAALLSSYLRRFTYVGSTETIEKFDQLSLTITAKGSESSLGELAEFRDGKDSVTFRVDPSYLTVEDTLRWATGKKPIVTKKELGDGGTNLSRTDLGFNRTTYADNEAFTRLLTNARGKFGNKELVGKLEKNLFPKLRSVTVTIGRIPQFERYLPGQSRRVISARGTVTTHDIDINLGRNQQYVRCCDIVVNVDADLNYGKTQLTDMHLVANVRHFVNAAYSATLQSAAQNYVGRSKDTADDSAQQKFWDRADLHAPGLSQVKVPCDENDVIALFFELTGLGHFPQFRWYGLSSYDTYDARAVIKRELDIAGLLAEPKSTDLRAVEFKLRGATIARDFDRGEKSQKEMPLVICYEIGKSPIESYQVFDYDESKLAEDNIEPFPEVTHVIYDSVSGAETQILAISEYLKKLYPEETVPMVPEDIPDDV